ncbi:MAG: hypothetical protein P1U30_09230 [Phycisphaerales bacterium]|nr:hypothetical protein [Phycisphaerales bacterium]
MTSFHIYLARQSTAKIGVWALVLIFFAVIIAIMPTVGFVKGFTQGTLHPVAEFDSAEVFEFVDPTPYSDYYLSLAVNDRDDEVPPMDISISNQEGDVPVRSINRWNSMMGREYKQFLTIPKQPQGILTIDIKTDRNESMFIFRRVEHVVEYELAKARLIWFVALIPLAMGLCLLMIILIRAINDSSKVDLHVSS